MLQCFKCLLYTNSAGSGWLAWFSFFFEFGINVVSMYVFYSNPSPSPQVLVTDPEKLEAIRARELDITKERLQKILATGVNVILCSGGIDDLCLKYFVEAGAMGVRRCKKADLKRIAKATGATFLTSLTNMEGKFLFFTTGVNRDPVHWRVRRPIL